MIGAIDQTGQLIGEDYLRCLRERIEQYQQRETEWVVGHRERIANFLNGIEAEPIRD